MKALTNKQITDLNLKHGWFEFGDAQSAKTKAFVKDVEAICAENLKAEIIRLKTELADLETVVRLQDELIVVRNKEIGELQNAAQSIFNTDLLSVATLIETNKQLEAELEKLIKGIMNIYDETGFEMDQDEYTSVDAVEMVNEIAENSESYEKLARKAESKLADIHDSEKFILSEDCPNDEVHCGCVPVLKRKFAELRKENERLLDLVCNGSWRVVSGFPKYFISSLGRIKNSDTQAFLKPMINPKGYPTVCLYNKGRKKFFRIHQLVLAAFKGPKPKGKESAHLDGDKLNNTLHNLCYATNLDNVRHQKLHDKTARGERHWRAKLTETQVREIFSIFNPKDPKFTAASLAKKYGVHRDSIHNILNKKTWKHINTENTPNNNYEK